MKGSLKWRFVGAAVIAALLAAGVLSPEVAHGLQFVLDQLTGAAQHLAAET